jgi:hypothetical protein
VRLVVRPIPPIARALRPGSRIDGCPLACPRHAHVSGSRLLARLLARLPTSARTARSPCIVPSSFRVRPRPSIPHLLPGYLDRADPRAHNAPRRTRRLDCVSPRFWRLWRGRRAAAAGDLYDWRAGAWAGWRVAHSGPCPRRLLPSFSCWPKARGTGVCTRARCWCPRRCCLALRRSGAPESGVPLRTLCLRRRAPRGHPAAGGEVWFPSAARQLAILSTVLAVLFACYSGPLSETRALVPRGRAWPAFFRSAAFCFLPISSCAGARFPEVTRSAPRMQRHCCRHTVPRGATSVTRSPSFVQAHVRHHVRGSKAQLTTADAISGARSHRSALDGACGRCRRCIHDNHIPRPWTYCICIAGIIALDHARALCSLFGCPSPHPDRR